MLPNPSMRALALGISIAVAPGCSKGRDHDAGSDTAAGEQTSTARSATARPAPRAPQVPFRVHPIVDEQQGGLVLATLAVPQSWTVTSRVEWKYQDVSHPVRAWARAQAPDGSAWVEYFPIEIFYWLEPVRATTPVGARSLGMIHKPHIEVREAVQRFVVAAYRGEKRGLKVLGVRPVTGLAEAFGSSPVPGEAIAARLRYVDGGETVDEDVYGMLASGNRVPYSGPQGTWYESHRPLVFAHAMGATNGALDSVYPLLGYIATSLKVSPAWDAHRQRVLQYLSAEFDRWIARGYAQIQAAAALSRTISANNDAMLASMQAQRQAQTQWDAARRASDSARSTGEDFSLYIRGTERMQDPYWGQSEQSSQERYHWTDGAGNYRSSNDPTFDPNVGAGGGATWQRMDAVPR